MSSSTGSCLNEPIPNYSIFLRREMSYESQISPAFLLSQYPEVPSYISYSVMKMI